MTLLRGINAEHQSAVANRPHRLGHATPRAAANDTLLEGFNGPVNDPAGRKYAIDLDGKLYLASLTAGGILYGVTGGIANVRRGDVLAIGTPYQLLRVNAGGTAPEWGSGRLTTNTTPVSTSGTGEDNLISYSVPAGLLAVNGQYLRASAWGTMTGTAAERILKLYFGATGVVVYDVPATTDMPYWFVEALIIRTGAATQVLTVRGSAAVDTVSTMHSAAAVAGAPGETLSGAVTLKMTGQCLNGADAITQSGLAVEYLG